MSDEVHPFVVTIERDGETRSYTLHKKTVTLRGGEQIPVHFFKRSEGELPTVPTEYIVRENLHGLLPLDWQILVARQFVELMGFTPDSAAAITGNLKGRVEGLSPNETQQVIQDIRDALEEQ